MIVDLNMPDMDGLKVCQAVRQFSNTPILVLSAVNKKNIVSEALNCGADDFLVKPMVSSLLIASVNQLARRARAEQKAQEANDNLDDQSTSL
jgi:DNA-binding response OmpR family regulator